MASWLFAQIMGFMAEHESKAIRTARGGLFDGLSGDVLELGAGSGVNFKHYPEGVTLTATDYSPHMLKKMQQPAARASIPVTVRQADAQALPFETDSFDHALITLVFCSIPDTAAAYDEIERVVRPGGTVRLLEHVAAPGGRTLQIQNRLTPFWRRIGDGCHLNRDTVAAARASGLNVDSVDTVDGTPRLFPMRVIRAHVPA